MLTLNFNTFPELTTERLFLRRITKDDGAKLFELRSNKKIMQYIDRPLAVTLDDAFTLIKTMDDLIDKNEGINWAITLKGKLEMIGMIGYYRTQMQHYCSEIGYILHPDYEKQGIMHEAMNAAIQFGFNTMNLHIIEGVVNPANSASIKVLERCGFVREGYFKENYHYNGKFHDSGVYSLLNPKE